jgi:hypothetical protein
VDGTTTIGFDGTKFFGFGDGSVNVTSAPTTMGLVATGTAQVTLPGTATLAGLLVNGDAKVSLTGTAPQFLILNPASLNDVGIADNGTVDLGENDVIVNAASGADATTLLPAITALVGNARNTTWFDGSIDRNWGGTGITSAAAKNDTTTQTGISIVRNIDAFGNPIQTEWPAGSGQTVNANSILLKYTFNGDANVTGDINSLDYALIDGGFLSQSTSSPLGGYSNGDFDFNGAVNSLDYALIDGAFLGQNTHVPPAPLAKVSSPFSTTKLAANTKVTKLVAKKAAAMKKLSAKQRARLLARRK